VADDTAGKPSVNALAAVQVARLISEAAALRVVTSRSAAGATLIDAGISVRGGLEAGRRIAEICMGGLGTVSFTPGEREQGGFTQIQVHSADPVLACLGSQYAGWSLSDGEGKDAFHALASGPGRAIARREELFEDLDYADQHDSAVFVLEVDREPPHAVVEKVVRDCALPAERLTFILTPTRSLAGTVQIVARVLEVALHKAHALGFKLEHIVDGTGAAPLPPPAPDFLNAMGRTNDAILFGGSVTLFVDGDDTDAQQLASALPASASRDYGRPFAQIFKEYKYDFYKIDPMLFAPAEVLVCNVSTGRAFRGGGRDVGRLAESFGVKANSTANAEAQRSAENAERTKSE
jgi:methenyltetrahydromethanopterin cyclohydrolase